MLSLQPLVNAPSNYCYLNFCCFFKHGIFFAVFVIVSVICYEQNVVTEKRDFVFKK